MIIGLRSWREVFIRHLITAFFSFFLVSILIFFRDESSFDVRLWRSFGDVAFVLLFITLAIGPISRIFSKTKFLVSWRRESGIWFAVISAAHVIRVFEFARFEPGIELASFLGYVALFWAIVLAVTSSDKMIDFIGINSWKWLHNMTYVIYYLVLGHVAYFLFWRYSEFNFFQYIYLVLGPMVPVLQIIAFAKEVIKSNKNNQKTKTITNEFLVDAVAKIADKTVEVTLKPINGNSFLFSSGQYMQVLIPENKKNKTKKDSRLFSIIYNKNSSNFSFAFRDSESEFKKNVQDLRKNKVIVEGPYGNFVLPKKATNVVFIAGGIGITPVLSIMRFLSEKEISSHNITLIYTNKSIESAAYQDELEKYSEDGLIKLYNKIGRVDQNDIVTNIQELDEKVFYIVGPNGMVASVKNILTNLGVSDEKIVSEYFDGYDD